MLKNIQSSLEIFGYMAKLSSCQWQFEGVNLIQATGRPLPWSLLKYAEWEATGQVMMSTSAVMQISRSVCRIVCERKTCWGRWGTDMKAGMRKRENLRIIQSLEMEASCCAPVATL